MQVRGCGDDAIDAFSKDNPKIRGRLGDVQASINVNVSFANMFEQCFMMFHVFQIRCPFGRLKY